AKLDKVNFAADAEDRVTPQATASEMQIRLIVHLDGNGQARLLQQVTMLWQDGTITADPNDPAKQIVQPGHFVLETDDALRGQFKVSAIRDGQPVGRRISAAAFGFTQPAPLDGAFGSALSTSLTMGFDDPLNPFKHKYHPDHDNLGYDFKPVPANVESYTITR